MQTKRIKLLKSVAGVDFRYGKGSIVDAPAHIAADLCKDRGNGALAVLLEGKNTKRDTTAKKPIKRSK